MELYAFNGEAAMAQAHDHPRSIRFMRLCADLQFAGQAFFSHDQRMVAGSRHRLRRVLEQRLAVMLDTAGFAVHQLMRPDHISAKSRADGLVSQANAQHWPLAGKMLY